MKYKPVYAVSISGEEVGYVENKESFQEVVDTDVKGYSAKNVDTVTLESDPEYELKLVNKSEETNEDSVLVAVQKEMKITYKYYDILIDDQVIDSVDTEEEANQILEECKEKDESINIQIAEKTTENAGEINTNNLEVASTNIMAKVDEDIAIKEEEAKKANSLADVNGVQIAVLPVTGRISSRYASVSRLRVSTHTGLDIAATKGTPIYVVADGTVISAGWSGSYGYLVKVDHGNNVETWYAHTSKMYVKAGDVVSAGDMIAAVGSSGNSTGPHLHFEIRINGEHVNPQSYIYK